MTELECPYSWSDLVSYLVRESSGAAADALEEHVFECPRCARRIEAVLALRAGVRGVVAGGKLNAAATSDVLRRAAERGLVLRSYRIVPGGEVQCTAGPEDDFIVVRLALAPAGARDGESAEEVDLETAVTFLDTGQTDHQVVRDIVVDRVSNEIIYLFAGDYVRGIPRSRWVIRARARGASGERILGPYAMDHTPWPG